MLFVTIPAGEVGAVRINNRPAEYEQYYDRTTFRFRYTDDPDSKWDERTVLQCTTSDDYMQRALICTDADGGGTVIVPEVPQ